MYGYVVTNTEELKIREWKEYRRFYCGLCHALKQRYGFAGQCSVSYDSTFLAILLQGLYEAPNRKQKGRCVVHPVMAQEFYAGEVLDYVADMHLVLSYLKCRDDWKDDRSYWKRAYGACLGARSKTLADTYREKLPGMFREMKQLAMYEKQGVQDLDLLAGCFGRVLAHVFCWKKDLWEPWLWETGYFLGKLIYTMDAYDDCEKDAKAGHFNPLAKRRCEMEPAEFDDFCRQVMELMAADCARAFEKLPIEENVGILRNILYSGIWSALQKDKQKHTNGCIRRK